MIIDHANSRYQTIQNTYGNSWFSGAYLYSQEIVEGIVPNVRTDRNWITVNVKGEGCDHAVVFVHNGSKPSAYEWMSEYDDLVLACCVPDDLETFGHLGTTVLLPQSVNVGEVEQYRTEKTKKAAFAGRKAERRGKTFPRGTDFIEGLDRPRFLKEMACYEDVYAVGRVAVEAKILGCNVLPYDPRFPDPDVWKVLDTRDAAGILQKRLDEVDGV